MSKFSLVIAVLLTGCSGLTVQKGGAAPAPTAKPGITWGEGGIGKVQVQKVGFWCDVRGKILTFGSFGETEAKALEGATANCRKVHQNGPCDKVACKPAS